MAQQINLRTPILLAQKKYFSADTMAVALAVFLLLGGALCAWWVWSLNTSADAMNATLAGYARERESVQAAIKARQEAAAPAAAALKQELQYRRDELAARRSLLGELTRGLASAGQGHAARLRLVAQSIPGQVWVTALQADDAKLDVHGFTLEPDALNTWVAALAAAPLLKGQALSAVKVERARLEQMGAGAAGPSPAPQAAASAPLQRPAWEFVLVSTQAAVPPPVGGASGARP